MTPTPIPFLELRSSEDRESIDAAIRRVLDRGLFVLGPEVEAFESEFATMCGARHAVGVGSGTDALAILLRALGIGAGDEVITTAVSSPFTALAIAMVGAQPVFADIQDSRATVDPEQIEAAVTDRTRAIVPVHLYGHAAPMADIMSVASRRGLAVIEDCAQAHLATFEGRPVGTLGIAGAFSFYPTKNLGALGDGGAIVTNDRALADRVRRQRNGGQDRRGHHLEAGVNSRLDELQAAVLRTRLTRLTDWTSHRRHLADTYYSALESDTVLPPPRDEGHVYHLFAVRSRFRDELQAHLAWHGIGTLVHYPVPVPHQPAFRSTDAVYPIAERFCDEVLSLPLNPALTERDVRHICSVINRFARHSNLEHAGPAGEQAT
jgi:dTDP-4-amino-4,6-dideoxygalactose transaminase